jgi:hypothetical protein
LIFFESEECSFGTDIGDKFFIGDIEIGEDLTPEEQYYALIHELGHAALFIERDENKNIVLNEARAWIRGLEARAWIRGLEVATLLNLQVNEYTFTQNMLQALNLYNKEGCHNSPDN